MSDYMRPMEQMDQLGVQVECGKLSGLRIVASIRLDVQHNMVGQWWIVGNRVQLVETS